MSDIKLLVPDDWPLLRDMRLAALADSPDSFLAELSDQVDFSPQKWQSEFDRGDWYIGYRGRKPVSMIGCTRETETPPSERFLEYLWVSPEWRGNGIAFHLLTDVIERLRAAGVGRALLWVMDGNDVAMRFYQRFGFVSSKVRQPLAARPGRSEELMLYDLTRRT
jgi:ribosomal protein S18 acetylase RimI-like enzyme